MARIRTIKPEICTSSQFVECSTNARLLFVLMLCFFDDEGNHPANCKRLKMEIFPADDFTLTDIHDMMKEIISNGLVVEYEAEGQLYWHITGFTKHQKVDRPNPKYPKFVERSTIVRRTLDDHSPPEGKGRERKGKESLTPPPLTTEEEIATETPQDRHQERMTIGRFRKEYREVLGVELGGGVNEAISKLCQAYTLERLQEAILAAATRTPLPRNPFRYVCSVLEGAREPPDPICVFDPAKDYEPGSYFYLLKQETLKTQTPPDE